MKESKGRDLNTFTNPLAVIQAAVDLLSKDPDNRQKIEMVCKILNQQTQELSKQIRERIEEDLAL